jgi:hypothetical protein
MADRPRLLYKYMSLRSEHTEAAVRNPTLWFSRPADFNDPYECRPVYTFKHRNAEERDQWYETTLRALARWDPEFSREREAELIWKYRRRYPVADDAFAAAAEEILQEDIHRRLIGVLSLSATGTDPVMFLHYGYRHEGICLRFRVGAGSFFESAEEVLYGDEYPVVDFFDDANKDEQFTHIFLTKYRGWQYEMEWRVVDWINGVGLHAYPAELLTGVIFAMNCSADDQRRVREWVYARGHAVQLYRATPHRDNYQMQLVPIA